MSRHKILLLRNRPEPLLSRCPPLLLPRLTTRDLTGFARRQGAQSGLSDESIEVIEDNTDLAHTISLRMVMRMIARAESIEYGPRTH